MTFLVLWLNVSDIYFYNGLTPRLRQTILWADIYFSYIFFLDLVVRFITRDRSKCKNIFYFILYNWFDIIPLIFEFPNTSGFVLPFWIFKLLRLIRLYKRFTEDQIVVTLMVKYPNTFLLLFVVIIIILCTFLLKIIEQTQNEEWSFIFNVIYFTIVTITSLGYGDYAPTHPLARIITGTAVLCAIGVVSTLSAIVVGKVVTVKKSMKKREELIENMKKNWNQLLYGVLHVCGPFNPVMNVFSDQMNLEPTEDRMKRFTTVTRHSSSLLNITVGIKHVYINYYYYFIYLFIIGF